MVDARDLKSLGSNPVRVRVPASAPIKSNGYGICQQPAVARTLTNPHCIRTARFAGAFVGGRRCQGAFLPIAGRTGAVGLCLGCQLDLRQRLAAEFLAGGRARGRLGLAELERCAGAQSAKPRPGRAALDGIKPIKKHFKFAPPNSLLLRRWWRWRWWLGHSARQPNVMHSTGIAGFLMPLAPRNFVPQIWQRNVGAEVRQQIFLPILPRASATVAREADHFSLIIAKLDRSGHAMSSLANLARVSYRLTALTCLSVVRIPEPIFPSDPS